MGQRGEVLASATVPKGAVSPAGWLAHLTGFGLGAGWVAMVADYMRGAPAPLWWGVMGVVVLIASTMVWAVGAGVLVSARVVPAVRLRRVVGGDGAVIVSRPLTTPVAVSADALPLRIQVQHAPAIVRGRLIKVSLLAVQVFSAEGFVASALVMTPRASVDWERWSSGLEAGIPREIVAEVDFATCIAVRPREWIGAEADS